MTVTQNAVNVKEQGDQAMDSPVPVAEVKAIAE
jgi:hypothetical protein